MIYSLQEKQKIKLLHVKPFDFSCIKTLALLSSMVMGLCLTTPSLAVPIWSRPVVLPGSNSGVNSMSITPDANGRGLAVWTTGTDIFSAIQTPTGAWEAMIPVVTYTNYGDSAIAPDVAFAADGTAAVVWTDTKGGAWAIKVATRAPGAAIWSAPTTLSAPGNGIIEGSSEPKIRFDAQGNGIAVWVHWTNDSLAGAGYNIIQSSSYTAGSGWSQPVDLSPKGVYRTSAYNLAVNAAGDTVIVWTLPGSTSYDINLQAIRKPAGTTAWSAPVTITTNPNSLGGTDSKVVIDDAGIATVAWSSYTYGLYAAQSTVAGDWSYPQLISTDPYNNEPQLTTDKAGNVTLVWFWYAEAYVNVGIKARMLAAGSSTWTTATKLSSPLWYERGQFPKVAASPDGSRVVVMWDDAYDAYASIYNPARGWGLGWSAPIKLAPVAAVQRFGYDTLSVFAGSGGSAHAVWSAIAPNNIDTEILGVTLTP